MKTVPTYIKQNEILVSQKIKENVISRLQNHFTVLAKKQLTHLVHKKMKRSVQTGLFKERAQQVLLLCNEQEYESTLNELEYLLGKQLQFC